MSTWRPFRPSTRLPPAKSSASAKARPPAAEEPKTTPEERDPFEEVDFGSFFNDYLDPGYRCNTELESIEKPSFENFLSKPTTLTDHLMWQLGAMHVKDDVLAAAELIIGNLSDDGYLLASDEELLEQGAGWLSAMEGGAALEQEMKAAPGAGCASPEATAAAAERAAAAAAGMKPARKREIAGRPSRCSARRR